MFLTGPVILMGTTPLCHGGILRGDLTVPILLFTVSCIL